MDTNYQRKKWDDYGESSLTLLAVHCGMDKAEPSIPYDSSDFRRCVHLIECLGLTLQQERELLNKMMQVYPIWSPFVKNWGKLMALYLKERNQESAPKLYKLLFKLRTLNSTQASPKKARSHNIRKIQSDRKPRRWVKGYWVGNPD